MAQPGCPPKAARTLARLVRTFRASAALATKFRAIYGLVLLFSSATFTGCSFYIDSVVPHHANAGDRIALRSLVGANQRLPVHLEVLFGTTRTDSIIRQDLNEVIVEIPAELSGEVRVSLWVGLFLVSNIRPFQVDTVPIVYRILAFGDSHVGPWTYHTHMLDTMLNQHIGPSLVINEGKAGETISEGSQRLGDVLSIHDGIEFIYILEGANDVTDDKNTPLGQMIRALEGMIFEANARSLRPILVTVPPRTRDALLHDQTPPTTEDWNAALRSYAIAGGIEWVDLYQAMVLQPGWEAFLDDYGLHLTPEGQEFAANLIYSAIAPLL